MNIQSLFPPEHRTPPLPLVSLFGAPEYHKDLSDYFVQVLRPPLVSLSTVDPVEPALAKYFGHEKSGMTIGKPEGILKADWFNKHRGRRPATAIAFTHRSSLEGDPSEWTRMVHFLKTIRDAAARHGVGMVVAVLQSHQGQSMELPLERVTGLCHNLALDPRQVIPIFIPSPGSPMDDAIRFQRDACLKILGHVAHEQCASYYLRQAQHVNMKHYERETQYLGEEKLSPPEMNSRTSFKLAVYAEFRQDWREAVEQYRAAYGNLCTIELGSPLPMQRWFELCKVAELVLLKLLMLLLHQGRMEEAVLLAQNHLALFNTPPEPLPLAANISHLGYVVRQHLIISEVLCSKLEAAAAAGQPVPSQANLLKRATLMMSAAQTAVSRRKAYDTLKAQRAAQGAPPPSLDVSNVRRVPYVGQLRLKTETGFRVLSDNEYLLFLEAEEGGRIGGPAAAGAGQYLGGGPRPSLGAASSCLDVLSAALVVLKDTQNERMRSRLGLLMAEEHIIAGNLSAARKLLLQICHAYRRDGWDMPLLQVLTQMRDLAARLRMTSEHLVYSLELCCIPGAAQVVFGGEAAATALVRLSLATLAGSVKESEAGEEGRGAAAGSQETASASSRNGSTQRRSSSGRESSQMPLYYQVEFINLKEEQRRARETGDAHSTVAEILLRHHQQDFGWLRCITPSVAMKEPDEEAHHVDCYVGLRNNLPVAIPLKSVTFTLRDESGQWAVMARPGGKLPDDLPACACDASAGLPVTGRAQSAETGSGGEAVQSLATSMSALELSAAMARPGGVASCDGAGPLTLEPGEWQIAAVRVIPRCVGKLQLDSVRLTIGDKAFIDFKVSSFPQGAPSLGCSDFSERRSPPMGMLGVRPGVHEVMIPHLGRLPTLTVLAPKASLVGEPTAVRAVVTVTGPLSGAMLDVAVKSRTISAEHISLTVRDDEQETLAQLSAELGGFVALPNIPASSQKVIKAWVSARCPGTVSVGIMLRAPSHIAKSVDIAFNSPFEHSCQINSESGVHTLNPQPPVPEGDHPMTLLMIGQPILVRMAIKALQMGCVELVDAKLFPNQESGLMPVAGLEPQMVGWPLPLTGGDTTTLLLPICPTMSIEEATSMGKLQLRWRRHRSPEAVQSLEPEQLVHTDMELPRVCVGESLLSAKTVSPAQVTAGISFTYSLQVQNFSGTPMEVAVTLLDSKGFVLSGDSRAVLSRGGIAVALTQDHSPDRTDEQDRVRAAGGLILNQNGIRVMGVLAMTRAIGDKSLREFGVIPDPDVISVPISSEDDFLILASDGLWDVVSNQEAVNIARLCKRKAILRGADHGVAARVAARVLMRTASQRGSSDNITVIVVDLSHTEEYKPLHSEPAPVRPSVISGFRVGTNSSSSSCSQAANYQGMHQAQSMRVVSSGTIFGSNECATLAAGNAKRMRIAFQPKAAAGKQQENLQKFISSYKQWPDAHKSAARVISA